MLTGQSFPVLKDYGAFDPCLKSVLLVRHAQREAIAPGSSGRETPLTREGELRATEFGNALPEGPALSVSHTGMARTIRTAECVVAGYALRGKDAAKPWLVRGQRGYVHSEKVYHLAHEPGFTREWLEGRIDPALIDPVGIAAPKMIHTLFHQPGAEAREQGSIYVHVGHDLDIYILQYFFWRILPEVSPADYLDGIILGQNGETLSARRNGMVARIPWR